MTLLPTKQAIENAKAQLPFGAYDIYMNAEMPMSENHFTIGCSIIRKGKEEEIVVHATNKTGKISKSNRYAAQ